MYKNIGDLTYVKDLSDDSFGFVSVYKQNNSNKFFTVEIYDKMRAKDSNSSKYICSELEILKTLNHPNIVKLIKVINDKSQMALFFFIEYCTGVTLSECFQKYQKKYQSGFLRK